MELHHPLLATVAAGCLASALLGQADQPASKKGHAAGALFRNNCSKCHTVPDPAVRSDLAWLDQVHRTS